MAVPLRDFPVTRRKVSASSPSAPARLRAISNCCMRTGRRARPDACSSCCKAWMRLVKAASYGMCSVKPTRWVSTIMVSAPRRKKSWRMTICGGSAANCRNPAGFRCSTGPITKISSCRISTARSLRMCGALGTIRSTSSSMSLWTAAARSSRFSSWSPRTSRKSTSLRV